MSCSPFDLRDYFLKELTDPQQRQVEAHVKTCPPCREELERLRLTEAALSALRDEEIPQRIAFVSDKIFEPSPLAPLDGRILGFRGAAGVRFRGHAVGRDPGFRADAPGSRTGRGSARSGGRHGRHRAGRADRPARSARRWSRPWRRPRRATLSRPGNW